MLPGVTSFLVFFPLSAQVKNCKSKRKIKTSKKLLMKKYVFGIIAIIMAIGLSAFTKPIKKANQYFFSYDGPDFTEAEVSNPANWVYAGYYTRQETCGENALDRPCEITVNEYFVLDEIITLTSIPVQQAGPGSGFYVPLITSAVPHSFCDIYDE